MFAQMLTRPLRARLLVSSAMVAGLLAAGTVSAQVRDRAGSFEFGLQIADVSGTSASGINGASIDVSNDTAWGVVGNYNFTNKLAVGAELTWADPTYSLRRKLDPSNAIIGVDAELDIGSFLVKGIFNFMDGAFTPYVEVGAGWVRIDSNVADGPPTTGCWWDPWWGYMCTSFSDTYSDTRTGYTYAVGLRWDVNESFLLRASYGEVEVDTNYAVGNISLDDLRFELLWKLQ